MRGGGGVETQRVKKQQTPLLKDQAYEIIKEHILYERFEPGRFLSERELIDLLEMSKTPIKSALVRLETEGFVTVSSKQGIIVNDLSIDRIADIYNLRIALETYTCAQVTGKLTESQCQRIEENIAETQEKAEQLDIKGFTIADHAFHLLICESSGNQEIYRVLLNYQDQLKRITIRHLKKDPQRMKLFTQEHVEIYQNLKNGDLKCVEQIAKHLQDSKQKLLY